MAGLALGLIEIVGLAAGIEAADAAVKSANVKLIGYELAKGGGLVTIKLEGEVGAVHAAVQAGCAAGAKVNKVLCSLVIPRPHMDLKVMKASKDTVGIENKKESISEEKELGKGEAELQNSEPQPQSEAETVDTDLKLNKVAVEDAAIGSSETGKADLKVTCNLCGDPACTRKKGEPRHLCLHKENYKKLKEE